MNNATSLTVNPFDEAFLADPYAHLDAIRDAGPGMWLESIGVFAMPRLVEVQYRLRHGK